MATVEIKGDIIPNDYKWIYDWLEWESTCPNDIKTAIASLKSGEQLIVLINSGGGSVTAGQEMYSLLREVDSVAKIQGIAASAAGVVAMGCQKVYMSPVAAIMIHNVSVSGISGDYHEMDKASKMLKTLDECMSQAFAEKSGMSVESVLKIMDKETWLTARMAMEHQFIDGILETEQPSFTNAMFGLRLTEEIRQKVVAEKERIDREKKEIEELLNDLGMYGV